LPSQHQLRWAQLRVGLTVIFACVVLALLIFLMSGTGGIFSSTIDVYAYFENAAGIRVGAPVKLEGVPIGNVKDVSIVPQSEQPPPEKTTPKRYILPNAVIDKPVRVKMTITKDKARHLRTDAIAVFETAGVLGETFIDVDATGATGDAVQAGSVLRTKPMKDINGMIAASQTTVENLDVLITRLNNIISTVENGEGTLGAFIKDDTLYRRLNATLGQFQSVANQISSGQGTVGRLLYNDELYNKVNSTVDKLDSLVDNVQAGHGTLGLLMKDETLYRNINNTVSQANQLIADINHGKGTLGHLAKDEEMARKLDNVVTKLSSISDQLAAGQGTAGRLLQDPKLYDSADQALAEARNLFKAVREDPKRYLTIHFKVF
jgi:phospholipid/cholesterol/gamma-HCH transport system substrate-binding protein